MRDIGDESSIYDGHAASNRISLIRDHLSKQLAEAVTGYSSQRWLWYLRRYSMVLREEGGATESDYPWILAEIASRNSGHELVAHSVTQSDFIFPINDSVLRRIARVGELAHCLCDCHYRMSLAVHGCQFAHSFDYLPTPVSTDDVYRAHDLYGERIEGAMMGAFPGLGSTFASKRSSPDYSAESDIRIPFLVRPHKIQKITFPISRFKVCSVTGSHVATTAQFYWNSVPLDSLAELHGPWWPQAASNLLLLLTLVGMTFMCVSADVWAHILMNGYLTIPRQAAINVLGRHYGALSSEFESVLGLRDLPPATEALLSDLAADSPDIRRTIYGRNVLMSDDRIMIDLFGASRDCQTLVVHPKGGGDPPNVRASHFEEQVQAIVRASPWTPTNRIRQYRGRTLRSRGQAITDIDAIGERDDALLIISCKSLVLDDAYFTGSYSMNRNYADMLEHAALVWEDRVERLIRSPRGDNFDFSDYERIIGIVVPSSLPFVRLGPCTALVEPGLRRVADLRELSAWLVS